MKVTETFQGDPLWIAKIHARISRALHRAARISMKYGAQSREGRAAMAARFERILDHAEKLGWIHSPEVRQMFGRKL